MLRNEEILMALGNRFLLYPLSLQSLVGASVKLTLSNNAWSANTSESAVAERDGKAIVVIPPNDRVLAFTNEIISIDNQMAGVCLSRLLVSSQGIVMSSFLVDPGYTGPLLLVLINTSNKEVSFEVGIRAIARLALIDLSKKTAFQEETAWVFDRALKAADIDIGTDIISEIHKRYKRRPEDLLEKMKASPEFDSLVRKQREIRIGTPRGKLSSQVFWILPMVSIVAIMLIYASNLSSELKTAVPPVISILSIAINSFRNKKTSA